VGAVNGSLTVRQVQILGLVAKGMSNGEIGTMLYLTENTVKQHVRKICDRLGARDRAAAVDQGWRQGYLGMWRVGVDWSSSMRRKEIVS
jgi:DNA-binding NarL/FixJ family response regulator